ncbi:hypothetical protein [Virgibacillus oceani]|uniref:hypothetical protein n=1 Tax=Virgibacillus oceani TaxID=1479511 RepID=UPI0027E54FCD|nr:hypothetical protein [Virgibacillus oceani]
MFKLGFLINLVLYIIGLFILYLIIQAAVRNGIDNSEVGKIIREKYGTDSIIKNDKKSFLDDDLDKD